MLKLKHKYHSNGRRHCLSLLASSTIKEISPGKRNVGWGTGGWGVLWCLFACTCMWISMKLCILQLAILPIFPVVGCTLGCCTEIPTPARICDRWQTQNHAIIFWYQAIYFNPYIYNM